VRPKLVALSLLALISLIGPIIERMATGRVEMLSKFGLAETLVSLVVLFWWYHVDKREWDYKAGPLMNGGVLALAIVALPVYFIRSRGWKKGAIATAIAIGFVAVTLVLGEAGERIGAVLGS
jgi:hypothetical protein